MARIRIPKVEISVEEQVKPKPTVTKRVIELPASISKPWVVEDIDLSAPATQPTRHTHVKPAVITRIRKRNGTIVEFDKTKIRIAMEKAARAVNLSIDIKPFGLIADHAVRHIEIKFKDRIPDVESVQDLVERTLMEYGLFDIAKAYILYRADRSKLRQAQKPLPIAPSEQPTLTVVAADGKRVTIDREKLRENFAEASRDFEETVDVDKLVEHCEANLYDGMALGELEKAMVLAARSFIEKDPAYSAVATRLALKNLYREVFSPQDPGQFAQEYKQSFVTTIQRAVATKRLNARLLDFNLQELADYIKPERDNLFEYLGLQVLYDRYFIREEGGERKLEVPQTFWMRVAMGLALNEQNMQEQAKRFYDVMSALRYVPSTPTLFHAATTYPQLSSCYLNTVEDDLNHIFKVYSDNAQLSKYSGGIGTDWTALRGTGALIKKTNVGSQGLVPFLKIANDVTVAINRSGKRRGATCVYLETWHYDYEDFLDLRRNTGDERRRTHDMNTASWVPDLLVRRVIEGGQWTLFSPDETPELHHLYGQAFEKKYKEYEKKADSGEIKLFKRMDAKDLWRRMVTSLYETGHPWMTFKDPSNVRSPQDHAGVIHNSNLCTEITLNTSKDETAVCNLGSINFARHMVNGKLDTALLQETVHTAMRMLDNVIELNFYPTAEAKTANLRHRPVGLGLMGFQDTLFMMGVDFDSEKAVQFADESMEFVSYHAIMASSLLAKERGAYPSYQGSKWDRGLFPADTLDLLEQERGMPIPVARTSQLDWTPVRSLVAKYGLRNSNTMAVAPTATIANIAGCFPSIEPPYSNLYVKSNMSGEFTVVNKYLVEELKRLDLWNETMLEDLKRNDGNIQDMTSIPPRLRNQYKSAFDIDPEWLIKIAAYRGKWIDQSQSLNIFFKGKSGRRLSDIYLLAWHMGLKTTYYLRTLGATSIEKSTIDLQKTAPAADDVVTIETTTLPNEPAPVAQKPKPAPTAASGQIVEPVEAPDLSLGKACLLNDPDCEACQ